MKRISLFLVTLLVAACLSVNVTAFDGNDYSGGSDSGYSSGGDYDSDYDYGGGGGIGSAVGLIIFALLGVVYIFSYFKGDIPNTRPYRRKTEQKGGAAPGAVRRSSDQGMHLHLPDRTAEIESLIKNHDRNFSSSDFLSFAKRVYIDIQTAWCKRDLAPVRTLLHYNLYDATSRQVQAKIDQGVIYHYESMVVNTAYLTSYAKDNQFEYLTIYLNARMIDWQEDEKTGRILRGDKTTRWDLRYKMKFMRSLGLLTQEEDAKTVGRNCPNCGAPLEMASSGQCLYCDSIVTTGQYNWVLSDFGTIRDDTTDEGVIY